MTRGSRRRTQGERRAQTHTLLLDATVECLVERGYGSTSTNDIIRLAGVSRGALLHHFASKADLMGEAVEHVFDQCEMEFREAFAILPVEQRTLEQAIDLLWAIFQGPSGDAALELLVAARTDPDVRAVLLRVLARFERNVIADFRVLFPTTAAEPDGLALVRFAFAALEGAAIVHDMGLRKEAEQIVGVLRRLAREQSEAVPSTPSIPSNPPIHGKEVPP